MANSVIATLQGPKSYTFATTGRRLKNNEPVTLTRQADIDAARACGFCRIEEVTTPAPKAAVRAKPAPVEEEAPEADDAPAGEELANGDSALDETPPAPKPPKKAPPPVPKKPVR